MVKAIWNNQVVAQSDETIMLEGNHYFPEKALDMNFMKTSELHSVCPYKGTASYKTIVVDGKENADAVWFYPETKRGFEKIKGYYAFWRGVEVVEE